MLHNSTRSARWSAESIPHNSTGSTRWSVGNPPPEFHKVSEMVGGIHPPYFPRVGEMVSGEPAARIPQGQRDGRRNPSTQNPAKWSAETAVDTAPNNRQCLRDGRRNPPLKSTGSARWSAERKLFARCWQIPGKQGRRTPPKQTRKVH